MRLPAVGVCTSTFCTGAYSYIVWDDTQCVTSCRGFDRRTRPGRIPTFCSATLNVLPAVGVCTGGYVQVVFLPCVRQYSMCYQLSGFVPADTSVMNMVHRPLATHTLVGCDKASLFAHSSRQQGRLQHCHRWDRFSRSESNL